MFQGYQTSTPIYIHRFHLPHFQFIFFFFYFVLATLQTSAQYPENLQCLKKKKIHLEVLFKLLFPIENCVTVSV